MTNVSYIMVGIIVYLYRTNSQSIIIRIQLYIRAVRRHNARRFIAVQTLCALLLMFNEYRCRMPEKAEVFEQTRETRLF
jgi:hypothetical protein